MPFSSGPKGDCPFGTIADKAGIFRPNSMILLPFRGKLPQDRRCDGAAGNRGGHAGGFCRRGAGGGTGARRADKAADGTVARYVAGHLRGKSGPATGGARSPDASASAFALPNGWVVVWRWGQFCFLPPGRSFYDFRVWDLCLRRAKGLVPLQSRYWGVLWFVGKRVALWL